MLRKDINVKSIIKWLEVVKGKTFVAQICERTLGEILMRAFKVKQFLVDKL